MILRASDMVCFGDSASPEEFSLTRSRPQILCVAHDLRPSSGWPGVECWQVGLVDGPGNAPQAYAAAALALAALAGRGETLVYCHCGGRALAVALHYLNAISPEGWDRWCQIISERNFGDLSEINEAHRRAFEGADWESLKRQMFAA